MKNKIFHTQEWRIKWDRFILSAMDRQFGMWKIRSAVQRILHSRNLDINRRLRQGKRSENRELKPMRFFIPH